MPPLPSSSFPAAGFLPVLRLTAAEQIRQPVTWLMTAVSLALLGLSFLFGAFNFEAQDRLRMLATSGIAVTALNGLFLGVVATSQSIHDELASRTALTLFAKPLGRGAFLCGKVAAVWLVVLASSVVLAAAHAGLLMIALHHGFDLSDHAGHHHETNSDLWLSWGAVVAGHLAALLQSALLTCISATLALRLPLAGNILTCFALFVLGNLAPGVAPLPALALFNLDDAVQFKDHPIGVEYVLTTGLYTALYCAGCLVTALALFRRQDIA
jgi:hypothetical protein